MSQIRISAESADFDLIIKRSVNRFKWFYYKGKYWTRVTTSHDENNQLFVILESSDNYSPSLAEHVSYASSFIKRKVNDKWFSIVKYSIALGLALMVFQCSVTFC